MVVLLIAKLEVQGVLHFLWWVPQVVLEVPLVVMHYLIVVEVLLIADMVVEVVMVVLHQTFYFVIIIMFKVFDLHPDSNGNWVRVDALPKNPGFIIIKVSLPGMSLCLQS